jgi:hypothetical protein
MSRIYSLEILPLKPENVAEWGLEMPFTFRDADVVGHVAVHRMKDDSWFAGVTIFDPDDLNMWRGALITEYGLCGKFLQDLLQNPDRILQCD